MEKEALIQNIWTDRKERVNNSPYALYVSISSPKPDLGNLTKMVLEEISNPKNARVLEVWARGWDKTIICVKPGGGDGCKLAFVEDDKSKSFVPIATTRKLLPQNLLEQMPEGELGIIVLNNTSTTIEAFLISYIHMVNQLIWDIYMQNLQKAGLTSSPNLYLDAVETVKEKGFSTAVATEDGLLRAKTLNSNVSIRLYGSGVNKDVQRVMGAILPPVEPEIGGGKFIDKLGSCQVMLKNKQEFVSAKKQKAPIVFSSVTFGKELHAGHMFLLATADLLRLGLGSDQLSLINNNTGPRAAGVLVKLSQNLDLSLEDTAQRLNSGTMKPETIIEAYRARIKNGEVLEEAFELLDQGKYDIFASMVKKVAEKLEESGFKAQIFAESENLAQNQQIIESINPVWKNTGFMFSAQKGVKVLRKNDQLTATGKVILSLLGLAKEPLFQDKDPFLVFVDGSLDSIDAVKTYSLLPNIGQAMQLAGSGIGFEGKIASGSVGEALTLTELLEEFNKACPGGSLSMALRQLVLSRPATMNTDSMSESFFYDFKDNQSLIKALARGLEEALIYRTRILNLIESLKSRIGDKTNTSVIDPKFFEFLPNKKDNLFNVAFEEIVLSMSKSKNITVADPAIKLDGFEKLGYGLNRFVKNRKLVDKLIMESLISGQNSAQVITELIRSQGFEFPEVVFGNDFEVKNNILEAVLNQGYTGEDAITRSNMYMQGESSLAVRGNMFLGHIKSITRLENRMLELSPEDFGMLETMLKFSLRRLGYEI